MVQDNVKKVMDEIRGCAVHAGRNPHEITLVAVTKFAPMEAVELAIQAGIRHIAENRVQEAQKKFPLLSSKYPDLMTHLIGHLQTNKAKDVLTCCQMIQSVDSLKLACDIEKQAAKKNAAIDVLIQFNTAQEAQKFGADPADAMALLEAVGGLNHLRVKGLMAMAPYTEDQGMIRKAFADLRGLRDSARTTFKGHPRLSFDVLSMGMSGDMNIAIEEGSTMVRVGSAIFKETYVNQP